MTRGGTRAPDHKRCPRCEHDLPLAAFARHPSKRSSLCRPCDTAYERARYARLSPEQKRAVVAKARQKRRAIRDARGTPVPPLTTYPQVPPVVLVWTGEGWTSV